MSDTVDGVADAGGDGFAGAFAVAAEAAVAAAETDGSAARARP